MAFFAESGPVVVIAGPRTPTLACVLQRIARVPVVCNADETVADALGRTGARLILADLDMVPDPGVGMTIQASGAALVAIVSDPGSPGLEHAERAGATHVIVSPFDDRALAAKLRIAERDVMRVPPCPVGSRPEPFSPDGVEPFFQPIVEIPTGRIVGFEALARWRHPRRGILGAEALLAAASRSGRVAMLGELVLKRSAAVAAAWDGPLTELRVSINITAADLRRRDFDSEVTLALFEAGLPASRVTLELTEGALVENFDAARVVLGRLRDSGVRIAIDDFGTGYSSLSYLKGLPVDVVKLDRSLVTDVATSERDLIIVHGIVEMAHSLGLRVVAEGVERHDQLAPLAAAGCEWYQGFLCSMPMPAAALPAFVAGWQAGKG